MCLTSLGRLVPLLPISVHENHNWLIMATRLCDITSANILLVVLLIAQVRLVYSQDVQWPNHTVCNSDRLTITYRSCGEINLSISICSHVCLVLLKLLNISDHIYIAHICRICPSPIDPLQDVGFTLLPCPNQLTDPIKIRLALILSEFYKWLPFIFPKNEAWRSECVFSAGQSVDELYSSAVLLLNGLKMLTWDEPLCLPHFPRFTFCGSRRGGEHFGKRISFFIHSKPVWLHRRYFEE